jgi:predicted nuclease with RNAse H fold
MKRLFQQATSVPRALGPVQIAESHPLTTQMRLREEVKEQALCDE